MKLIENMQIKTQLMIFIFLMSIMPASIAIFFIQQNVLAYFVLVVVLWPASYILASRFLKPLQHISLNAEQIAAELVKGKGDLQYRFNDSSDNELEKWQKHLTSCSKAVSS